MESSVSTLFDSEVSSRRDIDDMEEAIRNVRVTVSSSTERLGLGTRRCNILETASYMSLRMALLRWLSGGGGVGGGEEEEEEIRCFIGGGVSLRCQMRGAGQKPRVVILWHHSDNDGTLPVATPNTRACKRPPTTPESDDEGGGPSPPSKREVAAPKRKR